MPARDTWFYHESASAKIVQDDEGLCAVSDLYSMKRGLGHARGVMDQICAYADEHRLILRLIVQQFGDTHGMDNYELRMFYSEFDFIPYGDGVPWTMVRYPSLARNTRPVVRDKQQAIRPS